MRVLLALAPALVCAAADLAVKAVAGTQPYELHQRSVGWIVVAWIAAIALLALAVLPSRLVAASAGLVAGGVAGNAVSASANAGAVANPLRAGAYAFNLADVCVLAGVPVLTVALARVAILNRATIDRLIPPRRWEARLRRRLRL